MLHYLPAPWVDDDVEIGFIATAGVPGRFTVQKSEAMLLRETPQARNLSDFLTRLEALANDLATHHGGVLDLDKFLEAVPDRGTSVVFSNVFWSDVNDFDDQVELLTSKLPVRDFVGVARGATVPQTGAVVIRSV